LPLRRRFYFCVWVPSVHFLRDKEFLLFLFSWWWCCAVTQQQNYTHIFCVNKHHTLNPNGPSNERAAVSPRSSTDNKKTFGTRFLEYIVRVISYQTHNSMYI
jgi:hypothetical protein